VHRRGRHTRRLRHVARAPVRRICRLRLQRLHHNLLDEIIADLARCTTPWFVGETIEAIPQKPTPPGLYRLARCPNGPRDGAIAVPKSRQKNNLRAHRISTRNLTSPCATLQLPSLGVSEYNLQCSRHSLSPSESRSGDRESEYILNG